MLKYLFVLAVSIGNCHAGYTVPSDFVTLMESDRYEVTHQRDLGCFIYVVMYDKWTDTSLGYICNYSDPWVYPKFYPDEVAEKSKKIDRDL